MSNVLSAGYWLRTLRVAKQLTQAEAAKQSGVSMQAISRLEKGDIAKPPMADVVLYGTVLDATPNECAVKYGYWSDPQRPPREEDPRLSRLRPVLERLPDDKRSAVYGVLDYAYQMALATSAAVSQ